MSHTDTTFNGITIRKLHSPDDFKCFGYLTGILQPNGDLADVQNHGMNEYSAERRLGAYSIVDRVNGYEVRKLHSRDRRQMFGYALYHDEGTVKHIGPFNSLAEARERAGWQAPQRDTFHTNTLPKRAYAQNQPGYDPHSAKAR